MAIKRTAMAVFVALLCATAAFAQVRKSELPAPPLDTKFSLLPDHGNAKKKNEKDVRSRYSALARYLSRR